MAAAVLTAAAFTVGAESAAGDAAAEHQRIARERAAAHALFAQQQRECATRFVVNACLDEARQQRSATLIRLKREQVALDDAERRERAAARKAQVQAKLEAQAARHRDGAPVVSMRASAEPRRAPAAAASRASAPARSASQDAALRAERSKSQQQKLKAAQAHREAVEKRAAERAAKGKKAAPLPLPDSASSASAPR